MKYPKNNTFFNLKSSVKSNAEPQHGGDWWSDLLVHWLFGRQWGEALTDTLVVAFLSSTSGFSRTPGLKIPFDKRLPEEPEMKQLTASAQLQATFGEL